MSRSFEKEIVRTIERFDCGSLMVHSDVRRVRGALPSGVTREDILPRHIQVLERLANDLQIWFPTFNYDFPRSGRFDVAQDRSQVGVLSEHARTDWAAWRSNMPIFSFCSTKGVQLGPLESGVADPFDTNSTFEALRRTSGAVLFYGAPFHSITGIHFVEQYGGRPIYRYDKLFSGQVQTVAGVILDVTLNYHVRPAGRHLDYDWDRLFDDVIREGIAVAVTDRRAAAIVVQFADLCAFWREGIDRDPFYLLDQKSRAWVEPMIDSLGRPFLLEDFETSPKP